MSHFQQASAVEDLPASSPVRDELRKGWRPLLACTVGIGLGLSPLPPFTAGLFASALESEFGWSRGNILGSIIFITISLVLFGPLIGKIVDKKGARFVSLVSTLGLGISLIALSFITEQIWTFYLCWAFMSVAAVGTLPFTFAKIINSWFTHARGLGLGIALASTGVTGALAQFFVQWAIESHGWRAAYLMLAALPLLISLPLQYVFLQDRGNKQADHANTSQGEAGLTLKQALRSRHFWSISAGALALGSATGGLIPNLVPLLQEKGLASAFALQVMSALAVSVVAGRLLTGFLLDKYRAPVVSALLITPALIGLCALAFFPPHTMLMLFAAIAVGLIAGAEFDLVAYMTSRYFGPKHYSQIYSVQYAIFGVGSGVCPALYGTIRDMTGTFGYLAPLSLTLTLAGLLALLTLGRYPAEFAPEQV